MLCLGASLDFKRSPKQATPERNSGFNLSRLLVISFIISFFPEGVGKEKASKPEKNFRILSLTF